MARKRSVNNSANARAQGGQKEQKMKVQAESHANSNSNNVKGTASQTIQGPYEIQQAVTSSKQAPAPANPSFAPSLQSISPTGSLGQSLLFVQYPPSNSSGQMGSLQGQSTFQTGFSGQSLFFIQYPPSNPSGQMGSYQPQVSTSMAMGPYASPAAQHGNSSHYYNLYAATAPSYSTQGMYPYSTVTGNVYGSVPRLVGYNYGGPHVIPCLDDYGGQLGLELSKLSVSATTQDDYTDSTGNNLPSSNWQRFQDAGSNMPQSTLLDLMQSYTNSSSYSSSISSTNQPFMIDLEIEKCLEAQKGLQILSPWQPRLNMNRTIPQSLLHTDLPPELYRVYDTGSISPFDPTYGFLSGVRARHGFWKPFTFSSFEEFTFYVSKHANWYNRDTYTPFISVTDSIMRVVNDVRSRRNASIKRGQTDRNPLFAMINTEILVRHYGIQIWKMDDTIAMFAGSDFPGKMGWYRREWICKDQIPRQAIMYYDINIDSLGIP